jgi:restriction endonuclease-like protein
MKPKHLDQAKADDFLPGLPVERIIACYASAPGNEIESGKFSSPESSAALAANAFGYFLERPTALPPLPQCEDLTWPATDVELESIQRFPWSGGKHPCLDAVIITGNSLIGIESKRYEPFRSKSKPNLSAAYWRPVWGDAMAGYEAIRDRLRDGSLTYAHLDAAQLVKHAFGLRTAVHRQGPQFGNRPVLLYLFAEPKSWPDGRQISQKAIDTHRNEVADFRSAVKGCEVVFHALSYSDLLAQWRERDDQQLRLHAMAIEQRFFP